MRKRSDHRVSWWRLHQSQRYWSKIGKVLASFSHLDCQGTLIPVIEDVKAYSVSENVCWVLVVEKEVIPVALNTFVYGLSVPAGGF